MNEDVVGKVAALPALENDELKKLWQELFGEPAPRKKRDYLIPRLAWRIQELALLTKHRIALIDWFAARSKSSLAETAPDALQLGPS